METEEAKKKTCQMRAIWAGTGKPCKCVADECMWWIWDFHSKESGTCSITYIAETVQLKRMDTGRRDKGGIF